ncbi:MAG: helix-hairpin-helix domain-containing protein [Lachnospiraceae bacterium]|nr:helix-hairpin-helix domain-containing protein [Lachnospiraceae bacterium]
MKNKYIKKYSDKAFLRPKIALVILLILLVNTACAGNATTITAIPAQDVMSVDGASENGTDLYAKEEQTDEYCSQSNTPDDYCTQDDASEKNAERELICVFVCGAVCNPGVVYVDSGSRAEQALEMAGGFSEGANRVYVNLAAKVSDGQRLYFPYLDETLNFSMEEEIAGYANDSGESDSAPSNSYPININTADVSSLCSIPGIGETRANAIIEYRNTYGPFDTTEDIKNVSGIGEASYAKMAPYICVK